MSSPVGTLLLTANTDGLTGVFFETSKHARPMLPADARSDAGALRVIDETERQLHAYFSGSLREFDLPLRPSGTSFQLRVWAALRGIPYGETRSYGAIATSLGNPAASRAVGHANGLNSIPIIVPCHRVIGASGSLVGFGGGIAVKRWLLDHERGPERSLFADRDGQAINARA